MEGLRKTAIIILTYNHLDYTKDCLESIRKYTPEGTYEIIVVDNCSTDGTREWLKEQPDIKLRLNNTNVGFPAGCNIGIGMADPESDILLLNNDTIVTPRWLENLRTCLYSDPKIGAAGAVCNHNENLQGATSAIPISKICSGLPIKTTNPILRDGKKRYSLSAFVS